jgi:hypothetical protein
MMGGAIALGLSASDFRISRIVNGWSWADHPPSNSITVGFFVSAMGMGLIFHGIIEALQTYGLATMH